MHDRVTALGGTLDLSLQPSGGLQLHVRLPLNDEK
jgi:signal transduction histidine kinase